MEEPSKDMGVKTGRIINLLEVIRLTYRLDIRWILDISTSGVSNSIPPGGR